MNHFENNRIYWLFGVIFTYVLGNWGAFLLFHYLIGLDLKFGYAMPFLFALVPLLAVLLVRKGSLFARASVYRGAALGMMLICFLTWGGVVYVCLSFVYPSISAFSH